MAISINIADLRQSLLENFVERQEVEQPARQNGHFKVYKYEARLFPPAYFPPRGVKHWRTLNIISLIVCCAGILWVML